MYLIHVSILCASIFLDANKPHEHIPDTATLYVSGCPRCQLPLYPNGVSQRYFVLLAGSRIHSVRIISTFRDRPFAILFGKETGYMKICLAFMICSGQGWAMH